MEVAIEVCKNAGYDYIANLNDNPAAAAAK